MEAVKGETIFAGMAFGKLAFRMKDEEAIASKSLGYEEEKKQFILARDKAIEATRALEVTAKEKLTPKDAEIVEAHLVMLQDPDFNDLVEEGLKDGESAIEAVTQAGAKLEEMLKSTGDQYISERAKDVEEISGQIKANLTGRDASLSFSEPTILVTNNITVSELLSLNKNITGLALLDTGKTSHVSIVIRSLGIPALILTDRFDRGSEGKEGILDAIRGVLYSGYDLKFLASMKDDKEHFEQEGQRLREYIFKPTVTADGIKTTIYANISTPEEAKAAKDSGAEGIGLFRSEFIYMNSIDYPSEETQFEAYKKAVQTMDGKPVVIRTFDIGSDKKASYFDLPKESNPALGYRSIRICEDRPELFLTQLKALYRASAFGNLSIMIPMIISSSELDFTHGICEKAMEELDKRKEKYDRGMKIGIMVETPAAAVTSDILAKKAAFFSIGTNDLSQYTLAIDRTNENLLKFFDPHHKAILRLIALTVENGHKFHTPVSICGELAHDEKLLPFFLKIGVDHLSMSSSYILKTRESISQIDTRKVELSDYI